MSEQLQSIMRQPTERHIISDAIYWDRLIQAGMSEEGAGMILSGFVAMHEGRFAPVTPTLDPCLDALHMPLQQCYARHIQP